MKRLAFALAALTCAALPVLAADKIQDRAGTAFKWKDMGDGTYAEQLYIGGGAVAGPLPATIAAGQARIAVTATAVCLASAALVNGIVVKALAANAGAITIGGSGVNATADGTGNGYVLAPGEAMSFAIPNANLACINGAAGDGVSFAGN